MRMDPLRISGDFFFCCVFVYFWPENPSLPLNLTSPIPICLIKVLHYPIIFSVMCLPHFFSSLVLVSLKSPPKKSHITPSNFLVLQIHPLRSSNVQICTSIQNDSPSFTLCFLCLKLHFQAKTMSYHLKNLHIFRPIQ